LAPVGRWRGRLARPAGQGSGVSVLAAGSAADNLRFLPLQIRFGPDYPQVTHTRSFRKHG